MTRIPHYKEVILTSFDCDHCGSKNTGFQLGQVQDQGVRFEVSIQNQNDLSRQVVRSDHATVSVPEVQLEIPGNVEKGEVTTVEGILKRIVEGLNQDQATRRLEQPEVAEQIEDFIDKILGLLTLNENFTLIVDDPAGNSFVENLCAPQVDPQLKKKVYKRSPEQNAELGVSEQEDLENELNSLSEETEKKDEDSIEKTIGKKTSENKEGVPENVQDEVLVFSTLCDRCSRPTETNMKIIKIPYFKEVIIMAMHCEACGHRTNEVKSGTGVSDMGKRITLRLTDPSDLARDILKSETCELKIPDLDLHVGGGLIGGKFTTLEGLLNDIHEDLKTNPFLMGDSTEGDRKGLIYKLLEDLEMVIGGSLQVTFIMDDPAGNSYLQNIYAPDDDPEMTVEEYERTFEQNEDLGLNDMKTENYTDDSTANDISELS
ncbi:zinc finger protein ZPR1-like isoform X2 [Homarus americanus]|nr:zinc finger protein ZPR1-like isoform X2 [Homarus americanus]